MRLTAPLRSRLVSVSESGDILRATSVSEWSGKKTSHECLHRTPGRAGKARIHDGQATRPPRRDARRSHRRAGARRPARRLLPELAPAWQAGDGHPDHHEGDCRRKGAYFRGTGGAEEITAGSQSLSLSRSITRSPLPSTSNATLYFAPHSISSYRYEKRACTVCENVSSNARIRISTSACICSRSSGVLL